MCVRRFFKACETGDLRAVEHEVNSGLTQYSHQVNIRTNNQEMADILAKGFGVYVIGLQKACSYGNLDIVRYLIESCRISRYDLYHACRGNHKNVIKYLISRGADDYEHGVYGAAVGGHLTMVKYMLKYGVSDIYYINRAFEYACFLGYEDIVDYLIPYINRPERGLYYAMSTFGIQLPNDRIIYKLLKYKKDILLSNETLPKLYENSADYVCYDFPNTIDNVLTLASNCGSVRLISQIIKSADDRELDRCLYIACLEDHRDLMIYLVSISAGSSRECNYCGMTHQCLNGKFDTY